MDQDLYTETAYRVSRLVTQRYSTSFSASTRLFPAALRKHIYAIYGMVRIADEVVDTYTGTDQKKLIKALRDEVLDALGRGYSTNPIIQAFVKTAGAYQIDGGLIEPFFDSMQMDLKKIDYTPTLYKQYIYGSAEVVGLMCLRVFCQGDEALYKKLRKGAQALGSAYQKVNFLRDLAADYNDLGRVYFPGVTFVNFDEAIKREIIADIEKDFAVATKAIHDLPAESRQAVALSAKYYMSLLEKLKKTSAEGIKHKRVRIHNAQKGLMLARAYAAKVAPKKANRG